MTGTIWGSWPGSGRNHDNTGVQAWDEGGGGFCLGCGQAELGRGLSVVMADWRRDRGPLTSCLPFIRHTLMSLGLERQVSFWGHRELVRGKGSQQP